MALEIRRAKASDARPLTEIYNHYVAETHMTLDTEQQGVADRRRWIELYSDRGPHRLLVAAEASTVLGCASSSRYRDHPGFDQTVEVGIFLAPGARHQGIGTALYRALFAALADEPVHRAVAGIALPNDASIALHRRFGFREVGIFHEYAMKRGLRVSTLWMEKALDGAF